jgi:hypothetical protein
MPKYLIKATVVFHYELEAENHEEAVIQGEEGHNLEIHEFIRDVIEAEADPSGVQKACPSVVCCT